MLLDGEFDPQYFIFVIVSIVIGFTVHEFAHTAVAYLLGDTTPQDQGRLTLSPIVHLDIVGFLMFLFAGFGWAKPVEVNPSRFRNPLRDDLLVSLAGPLSNFLLAFLLARLYIFNIPEAYDRLLDTMILTNVILTALNLLPIPPLDGSRIIHFFLPDNARDFWATLERFSFVIIIALIMSGALDVILDYPMKIVTEFTYLGIS
ncbi:MAG: site-2 protease family protein [Actinobacteria bacterium]|nr:site-2 protease family protein [Actinomycetota bacterium]